MGFAQGGGPTSPSVVNVGGMRMSSSTRSGLCCSTAASSVAGSTAGAERRGRRSTSSRARPSRNRRESSTRIRRTGARLSAGSVVLGLVPTAVLPRRRPGPGVLAALTPAGIGASAPVPPPDDEVAAYFLQPDRRRRAGRVLRHVRDGFGDDEVGRRLDLGSSRPPGPRPGGRRPGPVSPVHVRRLRGPLR